MNGRPALLRASIMMPVLYLFMSPPGAWSQDRADLSVAPGDTPVLAVLEWVAQELLDPERPRSVPLPIAFAGDLPAGEMALLERSPVALRTVGRVIVCSEVGESMPVCSTEADPYAVSVLRIDRRPGGLAEVSLAVTHRRHHPDGRPYASFTNSIHEIVLEETGERWRVTHVEATDSALYTVTDG